LLHTGKILQAFRRYKHYYGGENDKRYII